jgi:hypothetical protein
MQGMDEGDPHGTDEPGPGPEDLSARLTRRRGEIAERIRQLHERERELAERPLRGLTPDQLARSRAHAEQAHVHARDAHDRAAEHHDLAADVHLRVADVLDEHGRSERARVHRAAARADRISGDAAREAARHEL